MTLQALSWAQLEEGDLRAARAAAVEAVALARKAGLSINESRLSLSIAMVDLAAGDYDRAWEHAQDAVDAARRTGDRHLLILGTSRLAEVAARRSELGRARDLLLSVLDHVVELQTDDGLGEFYDTLAALSLLDGDTDAASTFSARALGLATPGSVAEARVLGTAGAIATARAEPALATERYLAAARHLAQHGDGPSPFATTGQPVLASVAEGLAAVRVGVGDFDGAALLLGVAEGCKMAPDTVARPSTGGWSVRRLPAELRRARSVMDATRASLGDERFQERLAAGRELSLADAVAAAAAMPITAMFAPPVEGD
jgi:tetratricopeptide (TPR) repeat protein